MKKQTAILILALVLVFGCLSVKQAVAQAVKKGMIKVTILYPNGEGKTFDMDYYATKHIPMVKRLFGDDMKGATIDKGIAGSAPGAPAPYLAIGTLYFENIAAFQNGMKTYAQEIRADIPKYTNTTPIIQISEVIE